MQNRDFIKEAKEKYRKIGYVECPAFSGEKVYFTREGFRHLLRKGRELRPIEIQIQRVELIKHSVKIIRNGSEIKAYRKTNIEIRTKNRIKNSTAHFWSLVGWIDNVKVTVIVRKVGNGSKHFFSIF